MIVQNIFIWEVWAACSIWCICH